MDDPPHEERDLDGLNEMELEIEILYLDAEIALKRSLSILFLTLLCYATAALIELDLFVRVCVAGFGMLGVYLEILACLYSRRAAKECLKNADGALKKGVGHGI
jgi:hypothetical protein